MTAQRIIGVDVGGTKIAAGTIISGKLIDVIEIATDTTADQKGIVSQISELIAVLWTKKVTAIGIGVPGIANSENGVVIHCVNLQSLNNCKLRSILAKKFGVPVFLNNDAKAFALGQLSLDKKRKSTHEKHIVGLILGTGVGAGIIIDGKIYSGAQGVAGEVGNLLSARGPNMENLLHGKWFLRNHARTAKELFISATTASSKGSKSEKERARKIFALYGKNLGELLCDIILAYNPQRIVIGGSIAHAAPFFLPSAINAIKSRVPQLPIPQIDVAVKNYPGVVGAAALASATKK